MTREFVADIRQYVDMTERALTAVFRASAQDTIALSQKVVGRGGRMRIDTGFLRASGSASLNQPDLRQIENPYTLPNSAPAYDPNANLAVATARLGDTLYFTYTADYARVREYHDGFVRGATEQWDRIVGQNVKKARRAMR